MYFAVLKVWKVVYVAFDHLMHFIFVLIFIWNDKGRDYIHANRQHNVFCFLCSKMGETGSQITHHLHITVGFLLLLLVTVAKGDWICMIVFFVEVEYFCFLFTSIYLNKTCPCKEVSSIFFWILKDFFFDFFSKREREREYTWILLQLL